MNKLIKIDPFADLMALQRQFFGDDFFTPFKGITVPTTDVYMNNDKELVIEAHLPNYNQDDIDVHMENGSLVIQAEKHEAVEDKNKKYVVRESSSSFYRRINLPERVDENSIAAHMDSGVLKVTVPFKELPAPKRISIQAKPKNNSLQAKPKNNSIQAKPKK